MQASTTTPFGDCLEQSGSGSCNGLVGLTPAHFTDQDRDTETGLDHFMFRQYSSVQGRWMRPDPAGLAAVDPTNPQTWNRYAYVLNNPLALVDPLGLEGECYEDTCHVTVFAPGPTVGSNQISNNLSNGQWTNIDPNSVNINRGPSNPGGQGGAGGSGGSGGGAEHKVSAPPPPQCYANSSDYWQGAKAAASDFFTPPGADALGDVGDKLRDKDTQAAITGTIYVVANGAKFVAPVAEVAVKAIPVVGWAILGYQVVHAGYEGYKATKESADSRCAQATTQTTN